MIAEIRRALDEIEKDYPRAEDIAYGLNGRAGEGGGRKGTGVVGGHSDPTGEAAVAREGLRHCCIRVGRSLGKIRRDVDNIAADLDSSLRQSDDPHARAVRLEMADQARSVTKAEQREIQDERDRSLNVELAGGRRVPAVPSRRTWSTDQRRRWLAERVQLPSKQFAVLTGITRMAFHSH